MTLKKKKSSANKMCGAENRYTSYEEKTVKSQPGNEDMSRGFLCFLGKKKRFLSPKSVCNNEDYDDDDGRCSVFFSRSQ